MLTLTRFSSTEQVTTKFVSIKWKSKKTKASNFSLSWSLVRSSLSWQSPILFFSDQSFNKRNHRFLWWTDRITRRHRRRFFLFSIYLSWLDQDHFIGHQHMTKIFFFEKGKYQLPVECSCCRCWWWSGKGFLPSMSDNVLCETSFMITSSRDDSINNELFPVDWMFFGKRRRRTPFLFNLSDECQMCVFG